MQRATKDRKQGKAATTQAGEFVKEEMEHVKAGKHGAKSRGQAIAIGLSKARRAGVKVGTRRGTSAKNRRPVPGAKSTKAPQRAGARRATKSTRAPQRAGARRATTATRVSARTARAPARRRTTRTKR
jgi:hypothetical protein